MIIITLAIDLSSVFRLLCRNFKFTVYKTVILTSILYEYETWSVTVREENTPRFRKGMLRRD
jgi:hypothetical protein